MAKQNSIVEYMSLDNVKSNINQTLGARSQQFITAVASLINSSPELAICTQKSILSACLKTTALNLPIDNNLGYAYLIPYNETKKVKSIDPKTNKELVVFKKEMQAQLQIGYKGFQFLAMQTGRFVLMNNTDVREGEYKGLNRLTGEYDFNWITNDIERESLPIIGYVFFFRLKDGYQKTRFMTVEQIHAHAKKYSKTYSNPKGQWQLNFDGMARKTLIRLGLTKDAPLSGESEEIKRLRTALEIDQTIDGEYADNPSNKFNPRDVAYETERKKISDHINKSKSLSELGECEKYLEDYDKELLEEFNKKRKQLEKEGKVN